MRKLMVAAALGIVLLGACSGGGGKKAKSATTTTSQTNCDFAQNFTTNKIGASLTEAQAHTIASLAPEEIRSDVETVLLGAVKVQQVGQSSKSPQELDAVFTQQYKDAQQRVSDYVVKHCPANTATTVPPVVPG